MHTEIVDGAAGCRGRNSYLTSAGVCCALATKELGEGIYWSPNPKSYLLEVPTFKMVPRTLLARPKFINPKRQGVRFIGFRL